MRILKVIGLDGVVHAHSEGDACNARCRSGEDWAMEKRMDERIYAVLYGPPRRLLRSQGRHLTCDHPRGPRPDRAREGVGRP